MPPIKPSQQFYFNRGTGTPTVASNVPVDITGLSAPIGANETWLFHVMCPIAGAANGAKFQVTGPAAPTAVQISHRGHANTTAVVEETMSAFSQLNATAEFTTATLGTMEEWILVVNGANAGTIQVQFATASGTNTVTAQANRYIEGRRLA